MEYPEDIREIMSEYGEQLIDRMQEDDTANIETIENQVLSYAKQEDLLPATIQNPEMKRIVDDMIRDYSRELTIQAIEYIITWRKNANQNMLGVANNSNAETIVEGGARRKYKKYRKSRKSAKKTRKAGRKGHTADRKGHTADRKSHKAGRKH